MFIRRPVQRNIAMICILTLTGVASAATDTTRIKTDIVGMPMGTSIEVRLKNSQVLRGPRGAVSDSAFVIVEARSGERQIAFDDVVSVKQVGKKSHVARNILIGVGIGVAALAIMLVALVPRISG